MVLIYHLKFENSYIWEPPMLKNSNNFFLKTTNSSKKIEQKV